MLPWLLFPRYTECRCQFSTCLCGSIQYWCVCIVSDGQRAEYSYIESCIVHEKRLPDSLSLSPSVYVHYPPFISLSSKLTKASHIHNMALILYICSMCLLCDLYISGLHPYISSFQYIQLKFDLNNFFYTGVTI